MTRQIFCILLITCTWNSFFLDSIYADDNPFELISSSIELSGQADPKTIEAISYSVTRFPGLVTAIPGTATALVGSVSYGVGSLAYNFIEGTRQLFTGTSGKDLGNEVNWLGRDFSLGVIEMGEAFAQFGLGLQGEIEWSMWYWSPTFYLCGRHCRGF